MRGHGVPTWPDPTVDSLGRPVFPVIKAGISINATRSPQMLSKIGECQREHGALLLRNSIRAWLQSEAIGDCSVSGFGSLTPAECSSPPHFYSAAPQWCSHGLMATGRVAHRWSS